MPTGRTETCSDRCRRVRGRRRGTRVPRCWPAPAAGSTMSCSRSTTASQTGPPTPRSPMPSPEATASSRTRVAADRAASPDLGRVRAGPACPAKKRDAVNLFFSVICLSLAGIHGVIHSPGAWLSGAWLACVATIETVLRAKVCYARADDGVTIAYSVPATVTGRPAWSGTPALQERSRRCAGGRQPSMSARCWPACGCRHW